MARRRRDPVPVGRLAACAAAFAACGCAGAALDRTGGAGFWPSLELRSPAHRRGRVVAVAALAFAGFDCPAEGLAGPAPGTPVVGALGFSSWRLGVELGWAFGPKDEFVAGLGLALVGGRRARFDYSLAGEPRAAVDDQQLSTFPMSGPAASLFLRARLSPSALLRIEAGESDAFAGIEVAASRRTALTAGWRTALVALDDVPLSEAAYEGPSAGLVVRF